MRNKRMPSMLFALSVTAAALTLAAPSHAADRVNPFAGAKTWGYQLRNLNAANRTNIANSPYDLVVIDFAVGEDRNEVPLTREQVAEMQKKPDGSKRLVIAYLSIGEAETNRSYWKSCCAAGHPSWLTGRTQGWAGNYIVKFWQPAWKAIVASRVRHFLSLGYDGLYLDRVDTYENVQAPGGSRAAMIAYVRELAAQARAIKADAAIVVQNAEELLNSDSYVAAIDAIAKEDLITGANHSGNRNPSGMVSSSVGLLKRAKAKGKAVFVVEYVSAGSASSVAGEIRRLGFVPNFAGRSLSN